MREELTAKEAQPPVCQRCHTIKGSYVVCVLQQSLRTFEDAVVDSAWFYNYRCPDCGYSTDSHGVLARKNMRIFKNMINSKYLKIKRDV